VDVNVTLQDTTGNIPVRGHPFYALKKSHLFSSLSNDQIDRVCQHASVLKLSEDQPLFMQGDDVNRFYLVITGRIKLYRLSPTGQEKIIDLVSDGHMFAEALMFMDQPHYPVSASAISKSEVIGIDAKDFKAMLRNSVDTCFLLMADMSLRLKSLIHEIGTLSLQTGTCRVASYILENAPGDTDNFRLNIAKSLIASRVSVTPETFSRILKELCQKKILSVEGSDIMIHDRQALENISISKNMG